MKWLIVRFSAIGDCVMASHVPSRIRRSQPDAYIGWAVERRCQQVIDRNHLCNVVHPIPRDLWRKQRWSPHMWSSAVRYYLGVRGERYDYGLDLQGHSKTAICLRIAKPRVRLAVQATDAFARRLNPVLPAEDVRSHCVERALDCLRAVADFDADSTPIMPELVAERAKIRSLIPSGRPVVTIAVNAGQADKAYPLEKWRIVGDHFTKQGFTVVFLGGPESSAPNVQGGIDLVGKLSLAESMAAIDESALHLAGDTGAGHIAAAYDTPVLSVFGPTDPAVFRPYARRGLVLRDGRSTDNIGPEQVIEGACTLLETHGAKIFGEPAQLTR